MNDVCKADPAGRRLAVGIVVVGAVVGTILMAAFDRYDTALGAWILSKPGAVMHRVRLVFLLLAAFLVLPLLAMAAYLWSFGDKILKARRFPPPGLRVIRDTRVVTGEEAASRGRMFKVFALVCAVASLVLGFLLWRLAWLLSARVG